MCVFHSGWGPRRLPSMETDDFETIPSSAEESSNSSEEEGNNKNVGFKQDCSSVRRENVGKFDVTWSITGPAI